MFFRFSQTSSWPAGQPFCFSCNWNLRQRIVKHRFFLEKLILNPLPHTLKRSWCRRLWWHFSKKKTELLPTIASYLFSIVLTQTLFRKALKDNITHYCASMTSNDPWSIGKLMETDGMIFFPMIILHSYKLVFSLFAFRYSLSDPRMQ